MTELGAGQSVQIKATKYLTYTITNDGWGPKITATQGPLIARFADDQRTVSIGCTAPAKDDEV